MSQEAYNPVPFRHYEPLSEASNEQLYKAGDESAFIIRAIPAATLISNGIRWV